MTIIETKRLTYQYSTGTPFETTALNNVDVSIQKGEFVGVIGRTGSGKSTLIQHFNGLLRPSSGQVLVDGKDLWESKQYRREVRFKVGLVFQYPEYQLFEDTVEADIAFGPNNMQLSQAEVQQRVLQAAEMVGLSRETLRQSPFELSGGQKRRAAIAGVLAMRPEVLILDEPAAGLDPKGRERILSMLCDYRQKTQSTILLVSHNMEDIARLADRVLVMERGKKYAYDSVDRVFGQAQRLKEIGMDVPSLTRLFCRLQQAGFPVRTTIYTVEQAKREIERVLKEGGRGYDS